MQDDTIAEGREHLILIAVWSPVLQLYCCMITSTATLLLYDHQYCNFIAVWSPVLQLYCCMITSTATLLLYDHQYCNFIAVWSPVLQLYCCMITCTATLLLYDHQYCNFIAVWSPVLQLNRSAFLLDVDTCPHVHSLAVFVLYLILRYFISFLIGDRGLDL